MANKKFYTKAIKFGLYKNFPLIIVLLISSAVLSVSSLIYPQTFNNISFIELVYEQWAIFFAVVFGFMMSVKVLETCKSYNFPLVPNNLATWIIILIFNISLSIMYIFLTYLSQVTAYIIHGDNIYRIFYDINFFDLLRASLSLIAFTSMFSYVGYFIGKLIHLHKGFLALAFIFGAILMIINLAMFTIYSDIQSILYDIIRFFMFEKNFITLLLKVSMIIVPTLLLDYCVTRRYLCV